MSIAIIFGILFVGLIVKTIAQTKKDKENYKEKEQTQYDRLKQTEKYIKNIKLK